MSKKQAVGLVILLSLIFLIIVMLRACRTDYEDPTPSGPPSGEVSYASGGHMQSLHVHMTG